MCQSSELYYKRMIDYPSSRVSRLVYCLWTVLAIVIANSLTWVWVGVITNHPDAAIRLLMCAVPFQLIVLALPLSDRISCYFHFCNLKHLGRQQDKGDIDWTLHK